MGAWAAYRWEREQWPQGRNRVIDLRTARKLARKLCRRFKVICPKVKSKRGSYSIFRPTWHGPEILFAKGHICTGTVAHEVAHWIDWKRNGTSDHSSRFKAILSDVYCNISDFKEWEGA